ncbi:MAG: hypothetical protein ABIT36_07955 [Steroidobacteraceae bacterium]
MLAASTCVRIIQRFNRRDSSSLNCKTSLQTIMASDLPISATAPDRFIDEKVGAVQVAHTPPLTVRQVGEQRFVEAAGSLAAGRSAHGTDCPLILLYRHDRRPGRPVCALPSAACTG